MGMGEAVAAAALMPAIGPSRELVIAGVLMSYGNNLTWLFRTTAA